MPTTREIGGLEHNLEEEGDEGCLAASRLHPPTPIITQRNCVEEPFFVSQTYALALQPNPATARIPRPTKEEAGERLNGGTYRQAGRVLAPGTLRRLRRPPRLPSGPATPALRRPVLRPKSAHAAAASSSTLATSEQRRGKALGRVGPGGIRRRAQRIHSSSQGRDGAVREDSSRRQRNPHRLADLLPTRRREKTTTFF